MASSDALIFHSIRYLGANPGDIHFFPKFEKVPYGKLVYDGEFQKQTLTVMQFLSEVVAALGDLNRAGDMLRERVRTHKPRGISMAQFEVGTLILHFLGTFIDTHLILLKLMIRFKGLCWLSILQNVHVDIVCEWNPISERETRIYHSIFKHVHNTIVFLDLHRGHNLQH